MNILYRSLILIFASLLLATGAWSGNADFPEKPNPPKLVNDFAKVLSVNESQALEAKLVAFTNATSNQIAVVTMTSIGEYDVADYAIKLFNKWGVGDAKKDNGILLFVAVGDRKAWIVNGKGLQGVMTDARSSRIFRNVLRPAFKEGNYYGGLDAAVDEIISITKGEFKADKKEKKDLPFPALVVIIIFIVIVVAIFKRGGGSKGGGGYMSRKGGMDGLTTAWLISQMLNSGHRGGGGWSDGGGSSWGGGGFGGFGGGSSDGGGAGGSW